MNDILTYASVLFLIAVGLVSLWLIYMVVRKKPPFEPGTEPKHSWEMTREERRAEFHPKDLMQLLVSLRDAKLIGNQNVACSNTSQEM